MLPPCTNATRLNYFDGSQAGFGIVIVVLFLFPVGQYHAHDFKSISFCTAMPIIYAIPFDRSSSTVSFLVAYMVAYLRKYRYRKFQRKRKAVDRTEEPAVEITGEISFGIAASMFITWYLTISMSFYGLNIYLVN